MACGIFNCSMWDLVPRPGIKPGPPALGTWSLSHWTAREVFFVQFWVGTLSGVQPMDFDTASCVNSGSKCFKSAGPACEYKPTMRREHWVRAAKGAQSPERAVRSPLWVLQGHPSLSVIFSCIYTSHHVTQGPVTIYQFLYLPGTLPALHQPSKCCR